jgi:ribose transport system substrate-binding protein
MSRKLIAGLLFVVMALSMVGWSPATFQAAPAVPVADLGSFVIMSVPNLISTAEITATTPVTQTPKVVIPFTKKNDHPVIGFSQCTMNHPWRVAMVNGNVEWAKQNWPEAEVIATDGEDKAAKQTSDVDDLLARDVDILIISPVQADPMVPAVKKAMAKGIPVIVLDRNVNTDKSVFMGSSNLEIGEAAGKFACDKLGGKGNIIEIQGTAGAGPTIDRKAGFEKGIANCAVKITASQTGDYLREPAIKFMEDMLQKYPSGQIQAVYAHNDEMALGAIKAIKAAGRQKEMIVIGIDGQNEAIDAIQAGDLAATFVYDYAAPEGMIAAKAVYDGQPVEQNMLLPTSQIDATNVAQWIGKGF